MTALTIFYLACFQACTWPGIIRVVRRGSSWDLSVWREVFLLLGVSAQLVVFLWSGAPWQVWISPILSGASVVTMLVVILKYRG